MPKRIIPHNHGETPLEGFEWDGNRLTEFARWFKGDFCYIAETNELRILDTLVHIGDWIINEDNHFLIVDRTEFERDFDIWEDM